MGKHALVQEFHKLFFWFLFTISFVLGSQKQLFTKTIPFFQRDVKSLLLDCR